MNWLQPDDNVIKRRSKRYENKECHILSDDCTLDKLSMTLLIKHCVETLDKEWRECEVYLLFRLKSISIKDRKL